MRNSLVTRVLASFFVMLLPSLNKKRVGRYADGLFLMVMMAVGSILVLVMCKEFDGLFVFVISLISMPIKVAFGYCYLVYISS